jgi:hypothetical protein
MTTHNIHTSINSKFEHLTINTSPFIRWSKSIRPESIYENKAIMRRTRRYSFVSHPSIKYRSRFYMWELKLTETKHD